MDLLEARDILLEGRPGDREAAVRVLLRAGWSATRVLAEVPSAADLLPFALADRVPRGDPGGGRAATPGADRELMPVPRRSQPPWSAVAS